MGLLNKFLRQFQTTDTRTGGVTKFNPPNQSKFPQTQTPQTESSSLDDDLRKVLKRLPATTKRNLLLELGNTQGDVGSRSPTLSPTRGYDVGGGGGIGRASGGTMPFRSDQIGPGRRATAPSFAPISVDDEPATRRHSTAPNFASTIAEDEQAVEQQEVTAEEYARMLMEVDDLPDLDDVRALHKALKKADEDWVASFRDSGGMAGVCKVMAELAESRETYMEDGDDTNDHEVPEEEVELEEELVHCVMVLLNKPEGLFTLEASSELLPLLAGSAIDSSSSYVKSNLLKLLTIMAESGSSGFESVMNALDYQKVEKDEQLRFALLIEAFGDADSSGVGLVTDLIVFFNTVLSGAFEFEERVLLRSEMIAAGVLEAIERIRDYYGLSKGDEDDVGVFNRRGSVNSSGSLSTVSTEAGSDAETNDLSAQLDLFDAVMNEDRKDAIATGMIMEDDEDEHDIDEHGIDEHDINEYSDAEDQVEQPQMATMAKLMVDLSRAKDMLEASEHSDTESEVSDIGGGSSTREPSQEIGEGVVVQRPPDPPAVASMRSLLDKLGDKEETRLMVEIIAEKMENMVDAQCGPNQWKKIRNAVSSALESTLMDSDDDSDDSDDSDGEASNLPSPGSTTAAPLPAPASRIPPPSDSSEKVSKDSPPALPPRPTTAPTSAASIPPPLAVPTPPVSLGMPAAGPIPAPSALPGAPAARAIPDAPALPGMPAARSIPAPPALPGLPTTGAIPDAPALPGMPAAGPIPAPPALPGMPAAGAIPSPPALPGMPAARSIPTPPALPGMPATSGGSSIPSAPPLPGMPAAGAIPTPPALPGMPAARAIPAAPRLPGMSGAGGVPSPPPLPGMSGLPRPPPLPGMGGPPMPPPLPGMAGPRAPLMPPRGLVMPRPLVAPKPKPTGPKRRPVHWDKIPDRGLESTVFSEINPSSVELPLDLLMDSFAEKPKEKKTESKDKKPAAQKPAVQRVSLLDAKVLQNNGIVLKRFRTKVEDLRDSIVAMELGKFDTEKLIALRGIAPTTEELPKLKAFDGDLSKLDEVTRFMVLTARIPRYQNRLDCALFMKGFAQDASFLSTKLQLVDTARKEVVQSPRLKRLIEVVLAMGNYLNEGTRNGEARAIKLASLLRLDTVKTMDKKKTLLHVLMGWAKQKEPDLLLLDADVVHSSEASQWSLNDLKNQVTQLSKGFTLMQNQLKMAQGAVTVLEGDKFADVVEPFLEKSKGRMDELDAEYLQVQNDYDSCAKRFGEDPTKMTSGEFFALVSALVDMIAVGVKENEMAAKAEERRKKREAQEKKRQEAKAAKEAAKAKKELLASKPSSAALSRRGGLAGMQSRKSIRPSMRGEGLGAPGRGGMSGRGLGPSAKPQALGLNVNMSLLEKRRMLIAAPDDSDESDDDSDFWEEEEGLIKEEYERIKNQRVNEAVMLRKISKLEDPGQRDLERRHLPYQKSTLGRQQSLARQKSKAFGGGVQLGRQVSAIRQASNLRQLSAIRQASTVHRGVGGRAPSTLKPSGAGGGVGVRGGLSTGRLESKRMPSGLPGLNRRQVSSDEAGPGGFDRRKQFKTLKSTAFLA